MCWWQKARVVAHTQQPPGLMLAAGGTGTGAAPVVARLGKEQGELDTKLVSETHMDVHTNILLTLTVPLTLVATLAPQPLNHCPRHSMSLPSSPPTHRHPDCCHRDVPVQL
jgi:hypothetical protein